MEKIEWCKMKVKMIWVASAKDNGDKVLSPRHGGGSRVQVNGPELASVYL